jgi:hypothetical protein
MTKKVFIKTFDTTPFGRKSISQMLFSRHVTMMSVGQHIRTRSVTVNEGDGAKLVEGM